MRLQRTKLALLVFFLLALPAFAQRRTESIQGREVAAGQVLVKFKTTDQLVISQTQWTQDVDTAETVNSDGLIRMHSRSKDTASMLRNLSLRADVLYAEPDYIVHTTTSPTDPNYAQLWGLKNSGQTILGVVGTNQADIAAESAWAITTGSQSIVVGVVDTGTDYTHPDLAANMWNNPTGVGGCAIGTHGYNAIAKTCDPMDDNFHGTHVSGTIGAVGNNNLGVVGVNWNTSVMALKFLDSTGSGSVSDAITVIEFAIQAKIAGVNIRVLSNSWAGSGFSQALSDEIKKANTYDILFVAAAGNSSADNTITATYPANYNLPNVIAVAATDNNDGLASFSNYGSTNVHLGAPGVSILSTQPGSRYQYLSGTSMATPHVSGAAALLLSQNAALTTAQLKDAILKNVDPIPSLTGRTVTGGRLNVCRAMPTCVLSGVQDFSLGTSPSTLTVPNTGSTAVYTVSITRISNLAASISLSISGLPSGITAVFSPSSTTGSTSTLTLTASAGAVTGSYALTITGTTTSPALIHSTAITLVKSAPVVTIAWTKVAVEGDTVFLPKGTIYRFGVGAQFLSSVTTNADWTVVVSPNNLGGDPAYGIVKELDVQGTGAGVIVNGVPFGTVVAPPIVVPPVTVTWTKVAIEGDTVFLPKGTTYRFGVGTQFLAPVTTTADWTVLVYYTNLGGDPAPGVVKEVDVQGTGAGIIVNGVPFNVVVPPPVVPPVTWTKVAVEGDTVFLPKGTTYRFGIGSKYLASVTTTADWVVLVYYTNLGGDPAPGVVKELDVVGDGTGVLVNGTPFKGGAAPPPVTWTKITTEGNTVFLPKGTTYRFGIGTQYLASATTTADWTVLVYFSNFGGDPAPGIVKELDVVGDGTGVLVNGVLFKP